MNDPLISVSDFHTAYAAKGEPALGVMRHMRWSAFAQVLHSRRIGRKDGPCFAPCTFVLEPDGHHVHRLEAKAAFRTMIVLDIEPHKTTGEVPPDPAAVAGRLRALDLTAVVYTSHSHPTLPGPRYRVVMPLSAHLEAELHPVCAIVAGRLDLAGVLDTSKIGPAGLFYYPSSDPGRLDQHETILVRGEPIDAYELGNQADAVLAELQHRADEAFAQAERRRADRLAAGFSDEDSLIEKLRSKLDLEDELRAHHYDQHGDNWRHPNSSSGSYGLNVKDFGGIKRAYSHNATDPLAPGNLPAWCTTKGAIDAFDVVTILDFGGDRDRALRHLAQKFGLAKTDERRALAKLLFRMIRRGDTQEQIETEAFRQGSELGLTEHDVRQVAIWIANQRDAA